MMDEIQIWHVDVTGTQGVPYFKVTLKLPLVTYLILIFKFFPFPDSISKRG